MVGVKAQSLDAATPAPVRSNNLIGKIAARDLGDSRLTDHYYAFTGTPGDLTITIQSKNLNGDLDVFTAGSLRPLLKLTLYAETSTPVTKGIYLRKRESLILRVEARSPNDDEGTYQLFFGGSFEPIAGGPDTAENETPSTTISGDPRTKRVSSVGARLPEPEKSVTEIAMAPTPTPEPEKVEEPKPEKTKPAPRTRTSTAANTPRTRRPTTRNTTPKPKPEVATSTEETTKTEENKNNEASTAVTEAPKTKSTTSRTTPRRGTAGTNRPAKPKPEAPAEPPEPEVGPRLVIETSDGTLINRSMSTVRRVVVENGQVVVTAKDGKIDRIPLTNVVRMSIAP